MTHEFFGMGAVLVDARAAVARAAADLKMSFAKAGTWCLTLDNSETRGIE